MTDDRQYISRRDFLKLCGLSFLGLVLTNCNSKPTPPPTPLSDFLHIENGKVTGKSGSEILLRGICLDPFPFWSFKETPNHPYGLERINQFNSALYTHYLTEADIQEIKKMGVNVVRKQVSFYALETAPYQYNEGVLQQIDHLIEIAYPKGIYIIPALTDAAQNSAQQDNKRHHNGVSHLWVDNEWRQRVISAWEYIARRYANNPAIAGYDIINEPTAPTHESLLSFYSDVIAAIRRVGDEHIIILEKQHFENTSTILFGGQYEDENIMLSFHHYEDLNVEKEECDPNAVYLTKQELLTQLDEFLSQDEIANRPIFAGEFGAVSLPCAGAKALQWTRDILDVMNEHRIHYTYFSYKHIWGDRNPKSGIYYPQAPLFSGWQNQPIEETIRFVTSRMDELLTSRWSSNTELMGILVEKLGAH